jgi:primosomal protein N''
MHSNQYIEFLRNERDIEASEIPRLKLAIAKLEAQLEAIDHSNHNQRAQAAYTSRHLAGRRAALAREVAK